MPTSYPYTPEPGESITLSIELEPQSYRVIAFPSQTTQNHLVYMQYAGNYVALRNYTTTRKGLPSYMLKITLDGLGHLEYEGQHYVMNAGDFFWIDCIPEATFYTDPQLGRWHVLWIHLYGSNAKTYYDIFRSINGGNVVSHLRNISQVKQTVHQLFTLHQHPGQNNVRDVQSSALLLSLMSECIASVNAVVEREIPPVIAEIKSYLSEHMSERITLDTLGQRFFLSPFYIQRLFKKYLGDSPAKYILYLRIDKSKEYLITTKMSMSQIAEAVGIESASHFSTLFKSVEGMTPSAYRAHWTSL